MRMNRYLAGIAMTFMIKASVADAQPLKHTRRIFDEIGASAGGLVYQGDLSPSPVGDWKSPGPAISLQGTHIRSAKSAMRASLMLGGLRGDEGKYAVPEYRKERNLSFHTRVLELGVGGLWAPLGGLDGSRSITPFVSAQAGLALMRVRPDWSGMNGRFSPVENASMLPLITADAAHRKPRLLPTASFGIGLRHPLGDRWMMTAETGLRWAPSDYIDGFSQLANPNTKDQFTYHSIGLAYIFQASRANQCPRPNY